MGFMSYKEKKEQPEAERKPDVEVTRSEEHEIEIDEKMRQVIGGGEGKFQLTAPEYTTTKKGNLQVSYAALEDDYYYQIELLKEAQLGEDQILAAIIQAFSTIVPQHIHTYIQQPPKDIDWPIFTTIVKGGARLVGAKDFMEKKLVDKLLELNFWS